MKPLRNILVHLLLRRTTRDHSSNTVVSFTMWHQLPNQLTAMVQSSALYGKLANTFSTAKTVAISDWHVHAKRNYEQLALKAQRAELGAIKAALVISLLGAVPGAAATTYGEALSSGIQDISAVATLFGTEACASHLLSSISKGYIYASVSMLSMFGSLAAVKASAYLILPAEWLKNAGMTDCGADLNTIGWGDSAWPTNVLADRLHSVPGGTSKVEFSPKLRKWIFQATVAGLSGALGIVPFLAPLILAWDHVYAAFPIMRVVGGTLIGCLTPIATILSLQTNLAKGYRIFLQALLGIGAAMTLIGYVGCYAYIQSFPEQWMVYQWLALEIALMLIRFWCWAWNPSFDDMTDFVTTYTPPVKVMAGFVLPCYRDHQRVGVSLAMFLINVATHKQVLRGLRHAGLAVDHLPEASFYLKDEYEAGRLLWIIDTVGISMDGQISEHPCFLWIHGKATFQGWVEVAMGGTVAWWKEKSRPTRLDAKTEDAKKRLDASWKEINEVVAAVGSWDVDTKSVTVSTMLPIEKATKGIASWKLLGADYAKQCGCQSCLETTLAERLTCLWYAAQLESATTLSIKCITGGQIPWTKPDLKEKSVRYYFRERGRVGAALPMFNEERIYSQFRGRTDISTKEMESAVAAEVKAMSKQLDGSRLWLSHNGTPLA
ncbi:hypothetical protein K450DRAFT_298107 [Umbelopsis ramanniana AG]|uniref:Uncharacterized protein n=1 Tax=Umbelopsis ramanniana AG TaxID=1314678 RepID=A0AAD5EFN3_UMBRA|nr:uncharacterized protein K450DRAFT_298107 [Umbelopsis ramanniana AG]KAI8582071.1 hypothetical protein K450DRAFT_298107 [Umbelopsis ramanniana AG]